ncbi:MAG: hypothetical protein AB8B64_23075 [Granulosicoccus sp.]
MSRLCIVTALPAETRPLLDVLKLRQSKARHLRLYDSDEYLLLETGMGKLNASAAVGAVLQAHPDISMMVNLGVAGGIFNYGEVLAAHHVLDQASGAQWFPHLPDNRAFRDIQTASVITVDAPDTHYRAGVLFDMEATGIFNAASRFLSTSQIQSIKVVSDNPDCDIQYINKDAVVALIRQALPNILSMLDVLQHLALSLNIQHTKAIDKLVASTVDGIRHSVNDEQLLRQLVQQHITISGELPRIDTQARSAKDIRKGLQASLAMKPFVYGAH